MLPAAVVSHFPLRVDDGALTNFDDAVARLESRISCRSNQFDVSPLVAMVVDIVSNLAEQNPLVLQYAVGFLNKGRVSVSEGVTLFLRRFLSEAETFVEVFLVISPLVRDVRGVVDHHIEEIVSKRRGCIVGHNGGFVLGFNINSDDPAVASPPESTAVDGSIQDSSRMFARIERQHPFEQFSIVPVPHRGDGIVLSCSRTIRDQ